MKHVALPLCLVVALVAVALAAEKVQVGRTSLLIQGFEGEDILQPRKDISFVSGVPETCEVEVWDTALYNRKRFEPAEGGIVLALNREHVKEGKAALAATFCSIHRALRVSLRNNINQPSGPGGRPACNSLGHYDALVGDIYNPSDKPVRLEMSAIGGFAVTDKAGTFSLNRLLELKSGWNSFTLTAAEASAVFVDPHDTIAVEFRAPTEGTRIVLDNFRLARETIGENMAKSARCFDFGVECYTWPGFTYGSLPWDEQRGFGFTAGRSLTHGGDLHVINDALTRDGFRAPAEFKVKLPNGKYKVVVRTGNYWGNRDAGMNVEIKAEGKRAYYRKKFDAKAYRDFKYAHERTDHDQPGFDLWNTYENGTYSREVRFDTEVADGVLDLSFETPAAGGEQTSGESVWNYLIIYPADKAPAIEPEIDWLNEKIRTLFHTVNHVKIGRLFALYNREEVIVPEEYLWPDIAAARRAALAPSAEETDRGYLHFLRDKSDLVTPDSVPLATEVGDKLAAFGTPGETVSLAVGLYPLKDVKGVTVEMGDLTDAAGKTVVKGRDVEVMLCTYRPITPVTSNHAECFHYIGPGVLIPAGAVDLHREYPRKWWLSLALPAKAKPGVLTGAVTVKAGGQASSKIDVALRVLPFELDKPKGVTFAVAHNAPKDYFWGRDDNPLLAHFARLGLTTVWCQGAAEDMDAMKAQAGRYGLAVEKGHPDKYANWRWPENYNHARIKPLLEAGKGVSFTPRHTGYREGRRTRFSHGFWLWRSGIRHRVVQWQPNAAERVYFAHQGHAKFGPCNYAFPRYQSPVEGFFNPAPTAYEIREGIYDWRYLQTAEALAKAGKPAAKAVIDELTAEIDPSFDHYAFERKRNFNHVGRFGYHDTMWTGRRYLMARWELALATAEAAGKPIEAGPAPGERSEIPTAVLHSEYFGPFWVDASQFVDYSSDREGAPAVQVENPRTPVGLNWVTVLAKMRFASDKKWTAVIKDASGKVRASQPVGVLPRWKTRWVLATAHLPVGQYTIEIAPDGKTDAAAPAARGAFEVLPGMAP